MFLPLEGAGIRTRHPAWLEAEDIERHVVLREILDLAFGLRGVVIRRHAVPESEAPKRRHGATTAVEIVASDDVLEAFARENDQLEALRAEVRLHGIGGRLREPRAVGGFLRRRVAVHWRGVVRRVFAVADLRVDFDEASRVEKHSVALARNIKRHRRMGASAAARPVVDIQIQHAPAFIDPVEL